MSVEAAVIRRLRVALGGAKRERGRGRTVERHVVVLATGSHGMCTVLVRDLGRTQAAARAIVVHKRLLQLTKVLKQLLWLECE